MEESKTQLLYLVERKRSRLGEETEGVLDSACAR